MKDISEFLPQKPENIFVDEIDMIEHNKRIMGRKFIKKDERWVIGNDENPIIPASFIFETMSQFGGLLLFKSDETIENKIFNGYVFRVDKLKFLRHCKPGDVLNVESNCVDIIGNLYEINTKVTVDGQNIAEGLFTYILTKS